MKTQKAEEIQNNILYKYRGVANFEYLLDIIINNRLYAGSYQYLNDISEAHYLHDYNFPEDTIKEILDEKRKYGICSLSRRGNNSALWAHYADSHQGAVIALEIKRNSNRQEIIAVKYNGLANMNGSIADINSTLIEILKKKKQDWSYEEEVRILTYNNKYIDIKIKEIILGNKMSDFHKELIKKIVEELNLQIVITQE